MDKLPPPDPAIVIMPVVPFDRQASIAAEYEIVIPDLGIIIGVVRPSDEGQFTLEFTDEDFQAMVDDRRARKRFKEGPF